MDNPDSQDNFKVQYHPSNFVLVQHMNNAFGNSKGFADKINWPRIAKQSLSIADELAEVFVAMGAEKSRARKAAEEFKAMLMNLVKAGSQKIDLDGVRDGLSDIHVFAYGAHHLMGIDADADLRSVIDGVMTRFIKDKSDLDATVKKHADNGITEVYFEGKFPEMVMKSKIDQPDAPQHKFLKSASYREPVFYKPTL